MSAMQAAEIAGMTDAELLQTLEALLCIKEGS